MVSQVSESSSDQRAGKLTTIAAVDVEEEVVCGSVVVAVR